MPTKRVPVPRQKLLEMLKRVSESMKREERNPYLAARMQTHLAVVQGSFTATTPPVEVARSMRALEQLTQAALAGQNTFREDWGSHLQRLDAMTQQALKVYAINNSEYEAFQQAISQLEGRAESATPNDLFGQTRALEQVLNKIIVKGYANKRMKPQAQAHP